MKKMIAAVTLVVGLNAPAMANELAKEVNLTDIHAVNRIGVTYRLCLATKTFNDGTTEYYGFEGIRCGELARDLKEDPDLEDLPMTVNGKAYVNR
ncbi:Phage protein [Escherichia phage rV5_ev158]|nr:Phage protein [Escherichia phage rV5_ev168]VVA60512.1 Phage protein [Escherichia phage rV5_ev158]